MKRRSFLQSIAATTAGLGVSRLATARSRIVLSTVGANEKVRVALIGCGGRGRFVAERMSRVAGVQFVAACDVYERNRLRPKPGRVRSAKPMPTSATRSTGTRFEVHDGGEDPDVVPMTFSVRRLRGQLRSLLDGRCQACLPGALDLGNIQDT
jgi:hypothetical protein